MSKYSWTSTSTRRWKSVFSSSTHFSREASLSLSSLDISASMRRNWVLSTRLSWPFFSKRRMVRAAVRADPHSLLLPSDTRHMARICLSVSYAQRYFHGSMPS